MQRLGLMRLGKMSIEKLAVHETWSRDFVVFTMVFVLKVSPLSTRMQKFRMRADLINWLRDQPFEQGMIICKK